MGAFGLGSPPDSPESSPALPRALGTDADRLAYLYSIPQGEEDPDFTRTWARAVDECADARGWLALDGGEVERSLAHAEFGAAPGLGGCLRSSFRTAGAATNAAEVARRWAEADSAKAYSRFAVAALVSRLSPANDDAYVASPPAFERAAAALATYVAGLRSAERAFTIAGPGDASAPPTSFRGACARAAAAAAAAPGDASAARALARCGESGIHAAALLRYLVEKGLARVDAAADLRGDLSPRGVARVAAGDGVALPATAADAAALDFRRAVAAHARAVVRAEAAEAAALEACRAARRRGAAKIDGSLLRAWKRRRDAAAARRGAHEAHFLRPYDALCRLWDDAEVCVALGLASDALRKAREAGGLDADAVRDAADALADEVAEVADVDAALADSCAELNGGGDDDAALEAELAALLGDDDDECGGLSLVGLADALPPPPKHAPSPPPVAA